ncbi:thiamine pyrophosphate-dependent enzyme [Halomonas ventosae]|uniref:Thiamine pyrophosphate-dependent enzyme n=1 Tax=Halomonas ventosae TaxID=229007 RepID=A0A2T0VN34_9GAMM|nr:thiamine pyrophosphate-dependent enzyme [Halomonas ventosae]
MRSSRPGPVLIDLPIDVQMSEIEFDPDTYEPLPAYRPAATRAQAEKAIAMLQAAERPLIVAGGGILNADASDRLVEFAELTGVPVIPTLMGWGSIPDDHELMAGMVGLQTSHRYGNATLLASDFVMGIGNRWANRHTGSVETYTRGRTFVHVDIEPTQIAGAQFLHVHKPRHWINCGQAGPLGWTIPAALGVRRADPEAEGLGCKALRVTRPEQIGPAFAQARELMAEHRVPVVVEVILERVTNIAMGTEIDAINEFEELAEGVTDAPSAITATV